MRLRTVMVAVPILALILGLGLALDRRKRRLGLRGIRYGMAAYRLEAGWDREHSPKASGRLQDRIHRFDAIATAYFAAASRPWRPGEPDADRIECECAACRGCRASSRP